MPVQPLTLPVFLFPVYCYRPSYAKLHHIYQVLSHLDPNFQTVIYSPWFWREVKKCSATVGFHRNVNTEPVSQHLLHLNRYTSEGVSASRRFPVEFHVFCCALFKNSSFCLINSFEPCSFQMFLLGTKGVWRQEIMSALMSAPVCRYTLMSDTCLTRRLSSGQRWLWTLFELSRMRSWNIEVVASPHAVISGSHWFTTSHWCLTPNLQSSSTLELGLTNTSHTLHQLSWGSASIIMLPISPLDNDMIRRAAWCYTDPRACFCFLEFRMNAKTRCLGLIHSYVWATAYK